MIRSKAEADADFQRDIARWQKDLAMFEAEGLRDSPPALTIRGWIAEAEQIIAPRRFIEAARQAGASEDEAVFDEALRRIDITKPKLKSGEK
jgi:hypothetical protein